MNQKLHPPSDDYLLRYADEHIAYEVKMLKFTSETLLNGKMSLTGEDGRMLHNAVLEAFCIHVRNLIQFLRPSNPQKTDITILNYLNGQEIASIMSERADLLAKAKMQVNKQIAHLTTARKCAPEEKLWKNQEITKALFTILNNISRYLPHEKTSNDFRYLLETVSLDEPCHGGKTVEVRATSHTS